MAADGRTIKKSLKAFKNSIEFLRNSIFRIYGTKKCCTRFSTDRTVSDKDDYTVSRFCKIREWLYYTVFFALSNGIFEILFWASLHEKTSSKKLSQFWWIYVICAHALTDDELR